jgi:hypothetical protein
MLPARRIVMSEIIHGPEPIADGSYVARCSCPGRCIIGFTHWVEPNHGDEFYGELYTGFQPETLRGRLRNAWACLRGREMCSASVVLTKDAALALGTFLNPGASPRTLPDRKDT